MAWSGPMNKYNLPERRNYSMWIKNTADNMYLREIGILSLSNHEIGTHFVRYSIKCSFVAYVSSLGAFFLHILLFLVPSAERWSSAVVFKPN